jgi:Zn-dependent metalloprotease
MRYRISQIAFLTAFICFLTVMPSVFADQYLEALQLENKAMSFIERHRPLFLLDDQQSDILYKKEKTTSFGRVVHMQQYYQGIPVLQKSISLAFDKQKRIRMIVTSLEPINNLEVFEELIDRESAIDNVVQYFEAGGGILRGEPRTETHWQIGDKTLTKFHLVTIPASQPFGNFTFQVGGPLGEIVYVFLRTPMAKGYAYLANPVRTPEFSEVDLLYLTSDAHLSGENTEVYNCTGSDIGTCTPQQLAQPDQNGNYYIEPSGDNDPTKDDDLFVEVQAYYAINTVHDYFETLGIDAAPIKVGVNYPMPASMGPNAYYDPAETSFGGVPAIMMGQYQTIDLAVDNDVIFHEYGHHVFEIRTDSSWFSMDKYGPITHGLAINEASADYFSCSALDDPELGEFFASQLPDLFPEGHLRMIDNDLTCPEGLFGEAHYDGMVWSGFLWDARELLGQETIDLLYMDVLASFPTALGFPSATQTFLETAGIVLEAEQVEQLRSLAKERGLINCARFISIDDFSHTGFVFGKATFGQIGAFLPFVPGELHYLINIPSEATELTINLSVRPENTDLALLVRKTEPVTHTISVSSLDSVYDFILDDFGTYDLTTPDANAPFEPGATYFFHPINRDDNSTQAVYTISGSYSSAGPDGGTPDGGDPPSDDDPEPSDDDPGDAGIVADQEDTPDHPAEETGCSCLASGRTSKNTPFIWLFLAAILLGLRKVRVRSSPY